ncbi:MAG: hypothetical protein M3361_18735 [Candidatus Tectomicrobia bacterium]|nr:hypothetical protein [Candidatus Tectomicrobia bacterium]
MLGQWQITRRPPTAPRLTGWWCWRIPHRLTAGPGGVVPEQHQGRQALGGEWGRAPRQHIDGPGTHRAPGHTPEPQPVGLLWSRPPQQAITGQRLGLGIVRRWGALRPCGLGLGVRPTMWGGLGQPTPPAVVTTAERPRRLGQRPLDQLVAPWFCRADAGSGLVLPGLARCQATPHRRRARRIVSSLTRRGVRPGANRTATASASVHWLVGLSNVRGCWGNSARRDAQVPASKMVDIVCGRDESGCSTVRPRWWKACMPWRTG